MTITRKFKIVENTSLRTEEIVSLICENRFVYKVASKLPGNLGKDSNNNYVWYTSIIFKDEKNLTAYLISDTTINEKLKSVTLVEEEL